MHQLRREVDGKRIGANTGNRLCLSLMPQQEEEKMMNNALLLTALVGEEDDDSIIGGLREQIKQMREPKPRRIMTPEEHEAALEHYKDLRKPKPLGEMKEYIVQNQKPVSDYSYFLTTAPRYKWQWPLLLMVRFGMRAKAWAKRVGITAEIVGEVVLVLMGFAIMVGLCVM